MKYTSTLIAVKNMEKSKRFYDPDGHIIEVGEDMAVVVKRFAGQGMAVEQIAERMDVPCGYVREHL